MSIQGRFHHGIARGISDAITVLADGVFQNVLLLSDVLRELAGGRVQSRAHATPTADSAAIEAVA